jgi:Mrp family chromosome partitioning ATPase
MSQNNISFLTIVRALWKYKFHIALVVLVAGATSYSITKRQPVVYKATSTVMVESQQPKLALPAGLEITYLQDIRSQVELIRSNSVIERALIQLEPDKASDSAYLQSNANRIRNIMAIQQVKDTNIIAISITNTRSQVAKNEANSIAQAFVYEANQARTSAIENSLEKTNQQIKELAGAKVDVSINPTVVKLSSDIKIVLGDLDSVNKQIRLFSSQNSSSSTSNATQSGYSNLGWPLLETVQPGVNLIVSEINDFQSALKSVKTGGTQISLVENKARRLAAHFDTLTLNSESIDKGTYPEIDSKTSNIQQVIRSSQQDWNEIIQQVVALYAIQNDYNSLTIEDPAQLSDMIDRIDSRAEVIADNLNGVSSTVGEMQQLVPYMNASQMDLVKTAILSADDILSRILTAIQPSTANQSTLLTYDELSNIENQARIATSKMASAQESLKNIASRNIDPAAYAQLGIISASFNNIADIIQKMPEDILSVGTNGQSNLSIAALNSLKQELQLSLMTNEGGGIRVVDRATVSASVSGIFGRYLNVILAVMAALFLSVLSISLMQYFSPKVQETTQIINSTGLPLLATVSPTRNKNRLPSILDEGNRKFRESFRILRTNLRLDSSKGKIILITSPQEKEGKTTVAANLARAVALQGRKTLLIDGDVVSLRPGIPRNFGLLTADKLVQQGEIENLTAGNDIAGNNIFQDSHNSVTSLARLISSGDGLSASIAQKDGVDIISLGKIVSSSETTSSPRMKEFMLEAKKLYDVLIIDGSPILGSADTLILAGQADEVLLVLRKEVSNLQLANESKNVLESTGARLAGFVWME